MTDINTTNKPLYVKLSTFAKSHAGMTYTVAAHIFGDAVQKIGSRLYVPTKLVEEWEANPTQFVTPGEGVPLAKVIAVTGLCRASVLKQFAGNITKGNGKTGRIYVNKDAFDAFVAK